MAIKLFDHQKETVEKLKSGSILCGGVGSGKSITSLAYYLEKECWGYIDEDGQVDAPMMNPKDLYIITTARKRDSLEWERECSNFLITNKKELNIHGVKLVVDSWNNISKYTSVSNAFFIFDEQRVVGSGTWVKSFLKITKNNNWILLSATPGDTWLDYIPVFIANGFYKHRTDFVRQHVIFSRFVSYPKIDRYVDTWKLSQLKKEILVMMDYKKKTTPHNKNIIVSHNKELQDLVIKTRWNIYEDKPLVTASELCFVLRKITNSDSSRVEAIKDLLKSNPKIIIFYNFNYELDLLRELGKSLNITTAEWNGHKHQQVPTSDKWIYLVQYISGAEGWNCVETNVIVFYSQNYSYKMMHQAAGRIDRINTPFSDLYYYHLKSTSIMDLAISGSLKNKKNFNEKDFMVF